MKTFNWFRETPKKQIQRKQAIKKLLILIAVFTAVFIISGCLWVIIVNKIDNRRFWIGNGFGPKWYETKLFEIRPTYNVIKDSYNIWKDFSAHNKQWLTWLQVGCGLFAVFGLAGCWFFIDNKIVFTFSLMIFFGLLFNWADSVADGLALDYIKIKPKYIWIEYLFLWPVSIPYFFQGQVLKEGVINYPDIAVSIGVDLLIIYAFIKSLNCIATKIENKRSNIIYCNLKM